jgi:transcription initiation factor IIE alpha subunit
MGETCSNCGKDLEVIVYDHPNHVFRCPHCNDILYHENNLFDMPKLERKIRFTGITVLNR